MLVVGFEPVFDVDVSVQQQLFETMMVSRMLNQDKPASPCFLHPDLVVGDVISFSLSELWGFPSSPNSYPLELDW